MCDEGWQKSPFRENDVARLSAAEFQDLIHGLVEREGLAKLQEKLIRSHAVTSRRMVASPASLARTLHQLTLGLDRDCLPTQVVMALWEESLRGRLNEQAASDLEKLAERINGCLSSSGGIDPAKQSELEGALGEYRRMLSEAVGDSAARLTMLTRAVPAVAALLRASVRADAHADRQP